MLSHSPDAGFIAVAPQRNPRSNDWLGMGWIVAHPTTGSAGYFIAGFLTGTQAQSPLSQGSTTPLIHAGGSATQPTDAQDISPEEAQRRAEAVEKLLKAALFPFEIAGVSAVTFALTRQPIFFGLSVGAALVGMGFLVAAELIQEGVLPVPGGR